MRVGSIIIPLWEILRSTQEEEMIQNRGSDVSVGDMGDEGKLSVSVQYTIHTM